MIAALIVVVVYVDSLIDRRSIIIAQRRAILFEIFEQRVDKMLFNVSVVAPSENRNRKRQDRADRLGAKKAHPATGESRRCADQARPDGVGERHGIHAASMRSEHDGQTSLAHGAKKNFGRDSVEEMLRSRREGAVDRSGDF